MQNNLKAAILAALLLAPAVSFAQEVEVVEEESNFSWNAGLVSDYVFRGVSQTGSEPAIQGGIDYAFGDSGFYAGAWASNVDFGEPGTPNMEVDTYIGYNVDLGEVVNLDIMLTRYNYMGANNLYGNSDYNELITVWGFAEVVNLTLAYTNDYANTGADVTYTALDSSFEIGGGVSLNAGFGYTFSDPYNGDYADWTLGLSKSFGPAEIGLHYYDTNLNYHASDTIVLSVSFGG
jgi:uncharacterized protein (TIGR02001 family)